MKHRVPKKNISKDVADIKQSADNPRARGLATDKIMDEKRSSEFMKSGLEIVRPAKGKSGTPLKKIILVPVFFVLAAMLLWGVGVYTDWSRMLNYFNSASGSVSGLFGQDNSGENSSSTGGLTIFDLAKDKSLWSNAGSIYSGLQNFSAAGVGLMQEVDALGNNWPSLVFNGGGDELIGHLQKVKDYLSEMTDANGKLNSFNLGLGDLLTGQQGSSLSFQLSLQRTDNFLGALINWLSSKSDRHILVLFENSSEMRPGGGFIGSYADVVISGGSVKSFEVHNITDADSELSEKIIPPKQLRGIEKGWTIADSNWFFDYPTSASKTVELMELSGLYHGKTSFDGVVAISPKVVSDILGITGPIQLPGGNITINKDNFLTEVQKEVQEAQASGKPSKKIISDIAPIIISKLSSFDTAGNSALMQEVGSWVADKDLVIYFKDSGIEDFLDYYGASGAMFRPPADFNGDYLAVSSANAGSGKSDIFINQKVIFRSRLNPDGTADDHVEISRKDSATLKDPWWYRLPNESYMQIFAPSDALLSGFTGALNKRIIPRAYSYAGYEKDPTVSEIESTEMTSISFPFVDQFKESGWKVFGGWVRTSPGQTSVITADYATHLFSTPSDGWKYQFVFDKQTGSSGSYDFEIYAPIGFFWKESGSPVFEYSTDDAKSRIEFNLTLQKQKE